MHNQQAADHHAHSTRYMHGNERNEILNWLSNENYAARQQRHFASSQSGTFQWFFEDEKYKHWCKTPSTTLFCPGIPGAGKTTLTSMVIQELHTKIDKNNSSSISYVFFDYARKKEQHLTHVLASLLKQVAHQLQEIPEDVAQFHKKFTKINGFPSSAELCCTLVSLLKLQARNFIILDALDETDPSYECRRAILDIIIKIQKESSINLFVTTRYDSITTDFHDSIRLDIVAREEDIAAFLKPRVKHLSSGLVRNSTELQETIIHSVVDAVDGM